MPLAPNNLPQDKATYFRMLHRHAQDIDLRTPNEVGHDTRWLDTVTAFCYHAEMPVDEAKAYLSKVADKRLWHWEQKPK